MKLVKYIGLYVFVYETNIHYDVYTASQEHRTIVIHSLCICTHYTHRHTHLWSHTEMQATKEVTHRARRTK